MEKVKFTDTFVKNLKARGERYEVRGAGGLVLRVNTDGSKTWSYVYHDANRKLRRLTLGQYPAGKDVDGMTVALAHQAHRTASAEHKSGVDPAAVKATVKARTRERPTVAQMAQDFSDNYRVDRLTARGRGEYTRIINVEIVPRWGQRRAQDITRRDVIQMMDEMQKTPTMAARTLGVARRMFAWAVAREILPASPVVSIESPDPKTMRARTLTREELVAFFRHLNAARPAGRKHQIGPAIRCGLKFQLATATRAGEAVGARWDEIDRGAGWWTIPAVRVKNKTAHRVPLSTYALGILKQAEEGLPATAWPFPAITKDGPTDYSAPNHALRRCLRDWGFTAEADKPFAPFVPHDLRRTAATGMAALGVPPRVIDRCLNHLRPRLERTYDLHDYDLEARDAMERWGRFLEEIEAAAATPTPTKKRRARK